MRTIAFGEGSPEVLAAEVNLLGTQAMGSARTGRLDVARAKVAELEALTEDGAGGRDTLTKDSLLRLHSMLRTTYELLGDSEAFKRHDSELERLVRSPDGVLFDSDDTASGPPSNP